MNVCLKQKIRTLLHHLNTTIIYLIGGGFVGTLNKALVCKPADFNDKVKTLLPFF
jgi:hypothetical protein